MKALCDTITVCSLLCMFVLSIFGLFALIEGQSKQCEVTFQHNDKVIVHIGEWK